ncbi:alanine racemase [Oceanihabitans sediminis]|uniref:Alanine racemase n=1 Tax=Oceanihabitans sediminis TaxID=1812012 RepID=A0A368P7Y1_9FLAO|nr:alanine racemase [Oceanihabitans sediminis]MDX1277334.1 alanine racemase [Oceanihabitans sediminis]MDX1773056.1 alanine racemase [Oceanihabitans sediminis]RBP34749.1 alanine racemase [Oceanihabitans sediminis]RCU58400.1 alanine racemase [Oceanihabitans sediminis]
MPKAQETILEIDLNALTQNYKHLKSKLDKNTKFLAVVKAFAYGTDAAEIAKHLQNLNVDYFAVAFTNEGVALRDAGITKPILVLHPQPVYFKTIIARCLEPSIYSHKILKEFIEVANEEKQSNYPIHIKFNTGLNRLGFNIEEIGTVVSNLQNTTSVKPASIFSHLAASEDFNEKEFSLKQIETFNKIASAFSAKLGYQPMMHMCNTSGILNFPEAHFNMVRSGIGLYGYGNSEKENKNLKPIATLKSIISQIHTIEKGETIGYNRAFKAEKTTKTATIPIGHADGIGRQYGNGIGYVSINGKKAPIVGNVCMDMIMVDITDIICEEGDEVIVFDTNQTAETLANTTKSISYELLTAISQRVKRVFHR